MPKQWRAGMRATTSGRLVAASLSERATKRGRYSRFFFLRRLRGFLSFAPSGRPPLPARSLEPGSCGGVFLLALVGGQALPGAAQLAGIAIGIGWLLWGALALSGELWHGSRFAFDAAGAMFQAVIAYRIYALKGIDTEGEVSYTVAI